MEDNPTQLSDTEQVDWLRLVRTPSIGPRTFIELIERYGSPAAAIAELPEITQRARGKRRLVAPPEVDMRAELSRLDAAGGRMIAHSDPDYPAALAAIADPPPALFVKGDSTLLNNPTIAIVGARNASTNGKRFAQEIAADLANAGYVIVSGLAHGFDGAAHLRALATGTIAAVAGGIDVVYPPEHAELQARIGETGAVVSDQAIGTQPTARHFPARNRIISGLSAGVLVMEAALKSGSLITARLALEQGREAFAEPGSPRDPRCGGTNDLIRQGAALTETAEDILEGLERQMLRPPPAPRRPISFEPIELKAEIEPVSGHDEIVKFLGASPTGVDELVRECHMSAASVKSILLELELSGRIERHSGNRVSLIL